MAKGRKIGVNTIEKNRQTLVQDNRGSAIVMVLVSMAFVGIMVSMLMFVTYNNYRMKITDYKAKDNFYSADMAVDEIRAGVQQKVYEAFSVAYQETLQIYASENENNKNAYFKDSYVDYLIDFYRTAENSEKYDLDIIKGYVTRLAANKGDVGAFVDSNTCYLLKYEDGIRLKDIVVTYTDEQGYVSIIETDLLVAFPELGIQATYEFPDLKQYCIIADQKFMVNNTIGEGVVIEGSIYGGKEGIEIASQGKVQIKGYNPLVNNTEEEASSWAITDGDIVIGTAKEHNAASFSTSENVDLWAAGITLEGIRENTENNDSASSTQNLLLKGDTYIQDDLTVNATGMNVKLEGTFTGFGNASSQAKDSSAIIINGLSTTLDMSGLTQFSLGGNVYLDTSEVPNSAEEKNKDIKMGNSVASKAEQIAYLVPAECIGYDVEKNQALVGRNPINVKDKEYQEFLKEMKDNPTNYKEVNLSIIDKKLGKSLSSYGATYEKVYYQVDSENTWVYYYLKFASSVEAGLFFKEYYGNDKNRENLNKYIGNYIKVLDTGNEQNLQLKLLGNMVAKDRNGNYSLVEATMGDNVDDLVTVNKKYANLSNQFMGLCKKLTTNYGDLSGKERKAGVYYNIVNKEYIQECKANGTFSKKYTVFENTNTGSIVLLITDKVGEENEENNDTSLSLNQVFNELGLTEAVKDKKVNLVISEEDLIVGDIDFQGTIIVDGKLTIDSNKSNFSLMLDMANVLLSTYKVDDENEIKALSLFRDGKDTEIEDGTGDETQMTTEDLVLYENWTKR